MALPPPRLSVASSTIVIRVNAIPGVAHDGGACPDDGVGADGEALDDRRASTDSQAFFEHHIAADRGPGEHAHVVAEHAVVAYGHVDPGCTWRPIRMWVVTLMCEHATGPSPTETSRPTLVHPVCEDPPRPGSAHRDHSALVLPTSPEDPHRRATFH